MEVILTFEMTEHFTTVLIRRKGFHVESRKAIKVKDSARRLTNDDARMTGLGGFGLGAKCDLLALRLRGTGRLTIAQSSNPTPT